MAFRNRPTLDRKHRPRWQDELRSQQLIVAGFAVAIAIAIGIFGATSWSSYYDSHLRQVAYVGGLSVDRDALTQRTAVITALWVTLDTRARIGFGRPGPSPSPVRAADRAAVNRGRRSRRARRFGTIGAVHRRRCPDD